MKINYAFVVIKKDDNPEADSLDVLHMCLYENEPGVEDYKSFIEELKNDKTFGLTEMKLDIDYDIMYLNTDALNQYRDLLMIPNEI